MIIGVTGNYERGLKEIISTLLGERFSYEPLPVDFKDYHSDEKRNYFAQLSRSEKIVVDRIFNEKTLRDFKSNENFYLFAAHMPLPIKYFYTAKEKVSKKSCDWEYYESFFNRKSCEAKEINNCLALADAVFVYNSKNKSLESDIVKTYKKLL